MNLTATSHNVDDLHGVHLALQVYLWWHKASLVLHKVERIYHIVHCDLAVHTDTQEANDGGLQRVVHCERRALALLHVEADLLEATHVEERFVLDG